MDPGELSQALVSSRKVFLERFGSLLLLPRRLFFPAIVKSQRNIPRRSCRTPRPALAAVGLAFEMELLPGLVPRKGFAQAPASILILILL